MDTFGEVSFKLGGVRKIARGSAELTNAGLETAIDSNLDGSVYQTAKTKPAVIKIDLQEEIPNSFTAADMVRPQDVTFVEEHRGITHLYSNAKMIGEPSYSLETGAITGISFGCARSDYRRTVG